MFVNTKSRFLLCGVFILCMCIVGMRVTPVFASIATTCFDDGTGGAPCDGVKPPPISSCNSVQDAPSSITLIAYDGSVNGVMYLYRSSFSGCESYWGAVNVQNHSLTVRAIGMWETGLDGSNKGALDAEPITKSPGQWESTYMVGGPYGIGGGCYYVALDWTDYLGHIHNGWQTPGVPGYCP